MAGYEPLADAPGAGPRRFWRRLTLVGTTLTCVALLRLPGTSPTAVPSLDSGDAPAVDDAAFRDPELEFDAEAYPIGMTSSDRGARITAAARTLVSTPCSVSRCHEIALRHQNALPCALRPRPRPPPPPPRPPPRPLAFARPPMSPRDALRFLLWRWPLSEILSDRPRRKRKPRPKAPSRSLATAPWRRTSGSERQSRRMPHSLYQPRRWSG